jgi:hypothetical protein
VIRRALGLLAIAAAGCHEAPRHVSEKRPAPELRFVRELPLSNVGGDAVEMHVDPGGGLWVATPGLSSPDGVMRLHHRPRGGAWREAYRGPYGTELSLSSVKGGEVFLGFNLPYTGYRPNLLRVTDDAVVPLAAPTEVIEGGELLQVGAYAITETGGWACGQRGKMWRRTGDAWSSAPPVLPWNAGDPLNASYCASLTVDGERGFLADFQGHGAFLDARGWHPLPRDMRMIAPAAGLTIDDAGRLSRLGDGVPRPLGDVRLRGGVCDRAGSVCVDATSVLDLHETPPRVISSALPQTPRAVAYAEDSIWTLTADGVYRSTREAIPTFAPAAPGAIPAGIAFSIAADLDDDGHDDLVGLSSTDEALGQASVVAYRADGRGRFVPVGLGIPTKVARWRDQLDLGDLDGDGDLDVVLVSNDGRVEVWRNEGGRFSRWWAGDHPKATVALVDVDADGDLDLAVIPAAAGVLLNDGVGRFDRSVSVPYPPGFVVERAAWGDLDGDGLPDAVLQHWRDPAHLLHNRGGRFELSRAPFSAEGAAIVDLDGTGPVLLAQDLHSRDRARPFSRCAPDRATFRCDDGGPIATPAGLVVDLDLDGRKDVIVTDLRGDETMLDEGEVRLAREGGFVSATAFTGLLPQPTVLDADGDGDLDVYSTTMGLRLATANPSTWLRVRTQASLGDRHASGAWVLVRDPSTRVVVASARADRGAVTVGVPDASRSWDVDVRFPSGVVETTVGARAGSEVIVRDAPPARFAARRAMTWTRGTWALARPLDGVLLLATLAALFALRRRVPVRPWPLALGVSALVPPLVGVFARVGGGFGLLPLPIAVALVSATAAALHAVKQRREARRAGPYLLLDKLGQGAAATVWHARMGKSEVALKLFDAAAMTASESRIGSEVTHPNLVKIRDSGQLADGRCYLAMELVAGRSLAAVLAEGPLPTSRALAIAADVADALAALHDAGVIHRDVKPENVVVRADGSAVLTDLGLARSELFRTMTRHDVAVGTLAYMSPEQCVGRPLDGRTDLWSLGATLYELLTGTRPFIAEHELELVYVIHNVDADPPSAKVPGLPPEVDAVVARCLERSLERRYGSARSLGDDLRAAMPHG